MAAWVGPAIGAAGSLLGGILGSKSAKKAAEIQAYLNSPTGIREQSEKAGFNPLVFAPGGYQQYNYTPTLGNSISQAAAYLGESVEAAQRSKHEQEKQQLELENQRLENTLIRATLKANPPGVYGHVGSEQRRKVGRLGVQTDQVVSDNNAGTGDPTGGGSGNGSSGNFVDPTRKVEVAPYSSGAGLTEIRNNWTGGPIVVPGADGEPWGIDEVATAVAFGVPQVLGQFGYNLGQKAKDLQSKYLNDKKWERLLEEQRRQDRLREHKRKKSSHRDFMKDMYPTVYD